MRTARLGAALAMLAALAVGCTSRPNPPDAPRLDFAGSAEPTPPASPTGPRSDEARPEPGTPSKVDGLAGHLAVLDAAGGLVTMRADGTRRTTLAEIDADRTSIRQPSWSRDGERVAWVRAELGDDGTVTSVLETASRDGADPTITRTDVVPFYLSWDPTSSRIGYLGSLDEREIGFGVVELGATGERTTSIDRGAPFYLSWSPDGRELLAHIGEDRLERLSIDGTSETVVPRPGTFNVPVWTDDGATLIYGSNAPGGQALVAEDAETGRTTSILPFPDGLIFVASPDGARIAYQTIDESNPAGPLMVLDVASGERTQLVDHLVAAFFWSPDGERLLYLDPEPTPEGFWYRWGVWDGRTVFESARIVPSLLMVDQYLPFFEQYAQSMTLWSPDSSAFAYAGANEDGETGIWVQEARAGRAPVLVSEGDFVAWSPA